MDDFQFMDTFKRKHIKLTLKTATFLGVVQRINANKTVILEDVVDVKNGRKFPGVKRFFGHEILNVELPHVSNTDGGSADRRRQDQLNVSEFQPYVKSSALDEDDDDDKSHVNFVVIDEFHEKFGPAVMHIRRQQVIGIGADGIGSFQHERLCWLQIATKTKVYLFDILLLGARAFKNGLSTILQNNHILKVTHDCRGISGCLMAQFGVHLSNVFDTQVADVLCFYTETGGYLPDRVSTLQEVVSLHLKMPSSRLSSLKIKSQLTKEDQEMWYVRPCPVSLLKIMALSVIHLQPLRLVLLDVLMADYTSLVDSCLSISREEPVQMRNIGSTNVLEIPRELQNLVHMRQERQEWAVNQYPVTEQGWLRRSNPKPMAASQNKQCQDPVDRRQLDPAVPRAMETVVPLPMPTASPWASDLHAMPRALNPEAHQSSSEQPPGVLSPGPTISPGPTDPVGKVEVLVPPGQRPSPVVPQSATLLHPSLSLDRPGNVPGAGRGLFTQKVPGLSLSFSSFRKT
ncbi:hypothetical protein DPEC_G00316170 [Dallia pectoralis]|uniref:Uncharacterized protein n=1 Tax=Dallia pectoralis TaxID=75939 RepID=A0ACC2FCM4_DALPE|nr:hypothetical protein DPEC_G00316170 [Dallia pectoralis]